MKSILNDNLADCKCCPRRCGVNRLKGEAGFCGIGFKSLVAHTGLHFGEEPPISGVNGSGTIFFAGCNLKCVFCQNFQISQEFSTIKTAAMSTDELADEMLTLQKKGAHNINFVSPSHVIFQMAEAVIKAKKQGLTIPVVYNSNGYDSVDALREIRGIVDIYMPDLKYMDNELGLKFSMVDDYADIVPGVLSEMSAQTGFLKINKTGIAQKGLLVRHLVLPGFLENSKKCLSLIADLSKDTFVSLMSQYSPQYKAAEYNGINRVLTKQEYEEITEFALDLGLENVFVQDISSRDNFLPDFDRADPFRI